MLYPLFLYQFRKQFRLAQKYVKCNIYSCDTLREEYDKEFGTPSITLYTASDIKPCSMSKAKPVFQAAYLGNFGVGRHTSLIEIADALQAISPDLFLDVYGKIPDVKVQNALNGCKGIRYRGLIPYDQVIDVMQESNLLIHAESFDSFYCEDLKYGFSTKIADSLSIGVPFLLYASEKIACSEYLIKEKAAHVVTEKSKLYPTLERLFHDEAYRSQYVAKAIQLSDTNHNIENNRNQVLSLVQELCGISGDRIDESITNKLCL